MTAAKTARLEQLLALAHPTTAEQAELDALIDEDYEEYQAEQWEREQAQTRWAERGGYAAGLARPA